MCVLFEGVEHLDDGWGCCACRTYNRLSRDLCKFCSEPHHPLGTAGTPDILSARFEDDPDAELGCPHEPACAKCATDGPNPCAACGKNVSTEDTVRIYLNPDGSFRAVTHVRCHL